MTAQISNDIKYNGEVYQLLYESNYIFEPEKFGFYKTYWNCTACYAGYMIDLKVEDGRLIVERLRINDRTKKPPQFLGTVAVNGKKDIDAAILFEDFDYIYNDVNQKIEFTGKILIARERAINNVFHGYQPFYCFKDVVELTFENGDLITANDCSDLARRVREKFLSEKERVVGKADKILEAGPSKDVPAEEFIKAMQARFHFFDYENIRNIIKNNFYDEYKTKMWWYKPEYN